jgi:RpiR family transcriptional regulator, carbohydrate utilization regulator
LIKQKNGRIYCIDRIKLHYEEMFPAGKRIADYILNNAEDVLNISIKELAEKLKLNEATIVKFCKFLGYKGYKEFRVEFIKDFTIKSNIADNYFFKEEYSGDVVKDIFFRHINNLKDTLKNFDYDALNEAVSLVKKAKRIIFFASGASLAVAFDSFTRFLLAGFDPILFFDQDSQRLLSGTLNRNDVAIGISLTGETASVINCMKNSKKNYAKTICLTSSINSTITKHSDIKLFTIPIKSKYQKLDMNSRMAQIAMLDCIFVKLALNKISNKKLPETLDEK